MEQHYRQLESMYQAAPINEFYKPVMTVTEGQAEISIQTDAKHHHSAVVCMAVFILRCWMMRHGLRATV